MKKILLNRHNLANKNGKTILFMFLSTCVYSNSVKTYNCAEKVSKYFCECWKYVRS